MNDFEFLKNLLQSESWPPAVFKKYTDVEKAKQIQESLIGNLSFNSFLDFGCGDGFMLNYLANLHSCNLVGYDPLIKNIKKDHCLFTNDLEQVKKNAPYDCILIHDVLDYAQFPIEILKEAKLLLSNKGKILLRCIPWCSRIGGNLYNQINKAYVHLIFTQEELSLLGHETNVVFKVIYPIRKYNDIIQESGLVISYSKIENSKPEAFFEKSPVADRIKLSMPEKNGTKKREEFPVFQMSQYFLDFILIKQKFTLI